MGGGGGGDGGFVGVVGGGEGRGKGKEEGREHTWIMVIGPVVLLLLLLLLARVRRVASRKLERIFGRCIVQYPWVLVLDASLMTVVRMNVWYCRVYNLKRRSFRPLSISRANSFQDNSE